MLVSAGYDLLNVYAVIAVNPDTISSVTNYTKTVEFQAAIDFEKFLVSDEGQAIFAEFGTEEFGAPLFAPAVQLLKNDPNSEIAQWIMNYAYINGTECPEAYWDAHPELYN